MFALFLRYRLSIADRKQFFFRSECAVVTRRLTASFNLASNFLFSFRLLDYLIAQRIF